MKLVAIIAAALALTACATGNDAYYAAVEAREKRLAEQELRADMAVVEMAAKGDAQAKGAAQMYFALKNAGTKSAQQTIAAPKTTAEQLLPWASLIVPSITQFYSIAKNAEIAITNSNNSLEAKKADNDMITDLVKGRGPIVGTAEDRLIYPVAE